MNETLTSKVQDLLIKALPNLDDRLTLNDLLVESLHEGDDYFSMSVGEILDVNEWSTEIDPALILELSKLRIEADMKSALRSAATFDSPATYNYAASTDFLWDEELIAHTYEEREDWMPPEDAIEQIMALLGLTNR